MGVPDPPLDSSKSTVPVAFAGTLAKNVTGTPLFCGERDDDVRMT
jgi:hypothetical protein